VRSSLDNDVDCELLSGECVVQVERLGAAHDIYVGVARGGGALANAVHSRRLVCLQRCNLNHNRCHISPSLSSQHYLSSFRAPSSPTTIHNSILSHHNHPRLGRPDLEKRIYLPIPQQEAHYPLPTHPTPTLSRPSPTPLRNFPCILTQTLGSDAGIPRLPPHIHACFPANPAFCNPDRDLPLPVLCPTRA
jgi:hypothetical protein